ncbi:RING-H2 finger protein ATL8-like [Abrus precatorius]|uniref:RING-type E3 ubiquitin transferase n=1 Tax=Abrus precatorius TaxID=3816 RepID=A0A8B8KYQ6_ABRPR|nr:RING-H2 finger protein ATL8-like [Abrus precatorius]
MTRTLRILQSTAAPPPEAASVESDFVVILAALLCALVCVVGLIAIARCAWLRRGPAAAGTSPAMALANKGLKKKVLNSLPKFTYVDEGSRSKLPVVSSECAICLTEFAAGDEVRVLPQCGHGFHVACIDTWLASNSSCPSCRAPFAVPLCQKCGQFPAVAAAAGESEAKSGCVDNADNSANANHNIIITNGFSNYGFLP